jgi:Transposase DDE domain group 1
MSMAETMLGGGDFMVDLDHQRADVAGAQLRAVPNIPASTTFIGLAKRFNEGTFAHLEAANAELIGRWFAQLDHQSHAELVGQRPTIDLDPTDVEVFGAKKEGVAFNYRAQRCGRPFPATWAEAGLVLAADLGSGRTDPRPGAPSLIARAVAALPRGLGRPVVRADSGLFAKQVAEAALANRADFALAARRTGATWRASRALPETAWRPAEGMEAEVAECTYAPKGWPARTRCIVRRVKVQRDDLRPDVRTRRRRTIDPDQLRLLEAGEAEVAYAYSFIVTNLAGDAVAIEAWFRRRALIEERLEDAKLGLALRHLPSGYETVNGTWMWSAFFGLNCSVWLQSLAGLDRGHHGRAHVKRLRRELLCVPARVCWHARQLVVRVAPEHHLGPFALAWRQLSMLPSYAGP